MFGIQIGDEFLDLEPGQQFSFDETHPAFNDNTLESNNSFPIDIPAGGKNDSMLGIPADLNAWQPQYEYDITAWISGNTWRKARLIIDRPGTKKHGGYILTGIRSLSSLDKKLWEINLGGQQFIGVDSDAIVAHAKTIANQAWPAVEYNFPTVRNNDFYTSDTNPDWEYFINRWDRTNSKYLKNVNLGTGDPINKDTLVPMPYYAAIMKRIFNNDGWNIAGDWLTTPEAIEDVMWSNFPLDYRVNNSSNVDARVLKGNTGGVSANTNNVLAFDYDAAGGYYDNGGLFNTSTHKYTIFSPGKYRIEINDLDVYHLLTYPPSGGTSPWTVRLWKDTTLLEEQIIHPAKPANSHSTFNFSTDKTFFVGDIGSEIYATIHVSGYTDVLVGSGKLKITDISGIEYLNRYSSFLDLANHVPDKTVREFLEECRVHYNIQYDPDEITKTIFVNLKTDILSIPVAGDDVMDDYVDEDHDCDVASDTIKLIGFEWPGDDDLVSDNFKPFDSINDLGDFNTVADLPASPTTTGLTARVNRTNQRYITVENPLTFTIVWAPYCDNYYDKIIDPLGSVEIRDKITPLMMRTYSTTMTGGVLVPEISQQANSAPFGLGSDRLTTLRVIHYKGYATEGYPFATSQESGIAAGVGIARRIAWNTYSDGNSMYPLYEDWIPVMNVRPLWHKEFYFDLNYFLRMRQVGTNIVPPRRLSQRRIIFKKVMNGFEDDKLNTQIDFIILP